MSSSEYTPPSPPADCQSSEFTASSSSETDTTTTANSTDSDAIRGPPPAKRKKKTSSQACYARVNFEMVLTISRSTLRRRINFDGDSNGSYDEVTQSPQRTNTEEVCPEFEPCNDFVHESFLNTSSSSGIFVAHEKPDMNLFLKPLVQSLKLIASNNGICWTHPASKTVPKSKIACPCLCADAPAKAMGLKVKTFSHRYGCNICEQKAVKVKIAEEECTSGGGMSHQQKKGKKKTKTKKRHQTTLRRIVFLKTSSCFTFKCQDESPGGKGVCAEYMHTALFGTVKYFLSIFTTEKGPWNISKNISEIDKFVKTIKVPDFIKRLPRGLSDLPYLKASELRAFLLFYSLPALENYLPQEYFQHWLLLVAAIYLLLKESISDDDFLYEGSSVTTNQAILKVLKVYISQRKTKARLNADVKLTKSLLPEPNSFPSSAKNLLKKLEQLSPFQKEISHHFCSLCKSRKISEVEECSCGHKSTSSFYEFSVEDQIRYMFEHRDLASAIDSYRSQRVSKAGCTSDIQDGTEYCRVRSNESSVADQGSPGCLWGCPECPNSYLEHRGEVEFDEAAAQMRTLPAVEAALWLKEARAARQVAGDEAVGAAEAAANAILDA
ncbi:hypothetical protein FOCC_FOCC013936 [Frankliniella occidentalis]|nr:hypothetical protein FOCC_FOCC013936 [Frankliniella occidentalis]